jgi:sulfur-oxidizing protein SoxZ
VLRVEPSSGIAANPLFEFFVRATETVEMHVEWVDDRGNRGEHKQTMIVLPTVS